MAKGKSVLTTGDVAKICNVAPRTVSKWFDQGQLKGYRIPGSKDRRIPVNELIRFMKLHNMPIGSLFVGKLRILIADGDNPDIAALESQLVEKGNYEVEVVHSNFETGVISQKFEPHVLMLSLLSNAINAMDIFKNMRNNDDLQAIKIIAITDNLSDSEISALIQKGFDGCINSDADISDVIRKIEEVTAIIY